MFALKQKKRSSFVELSTETSKTSASSFFMKKVLIHSLVTMVRRLAVNLTWNFVDSDLPLGKTFRVCFKLVLYRGSVQSQEITSH